MLVNKVKYRTFQLFLAQKWKINFGFFTLYLFAADLGLTGAAQAAFVARSAGACGVQYGLVAGICTVTHCGLQRYRGKSDWVNGLVAGAVAGGAIAAMTRSWTQVIPMACLVSAFKVATDYARAI
ncbi:outer envelope pore protein 16-4 [Pyrus ussuriensis x Pyrus communis]|uniref:Outer envelope pore protein 16-4 n=1 Tax=Pyrus ussuriensis x Pyrus communis TaxID=2448454 RepID=A0A5N5GLQ2_9ROSA|nr:outer envelope pore protein 16-4 [Pyrus ussuriensis x Pyrus communis]